MSDYKACPVCGGAREVPDYSPVQHAIVSRKCPNCKGRPWPPKRVKLVQRNPSYGIALAVERFVDYLSQCEREGLVPISRNTYDTWRRRARQAAAGRGKQPPGCR